MLDKYKNLGLTPISEDEPAGVNYRYGDEYERVSEEVSALDSVAGGSVDWDVVADNCYIILSEKSKDMRISAYLARALYHQHSYAGLAVALQILHSICDQWWDDAMPPVVKPRGRIGALGWLNAKLPGMLVRPSASEQDDWQVCCDELARLQSLCIDKLDDGVFSQLVSKLNEAEALSSAPKKASATKPAATPSPVAAQATAAASDLGVTATSDPNMPDAPEADTSSNAALRKSLTDIAGYMISYYPEQVLGYQVGRYLAWQPIQQLPEADSEGVTMLSPPPIERIRQYQDMLLSGQSLTSLIGMVEMSIIRCPFWLGGNHLVWQALQQAGHTLAAQAVVDMTQKFLNKMPSLQTLYFASGEAFVDVETQAWVDEHTSNKSTPTMTSRVVSAAGQGETLEQANAKVEAGDLAAALGLFADGMSNTTTPRDCYVWELEQSKFWVQNDYHALAIGRLADLYNDAQRLNLQQWEPNLVEDTVLTLSAALIEQYGSSENIPVCWQATFEAMQADYPDLL